MTLINRVRAFIPALLLALPATAFAGGPADTTYALVLYAGGGASIYAATPGTPTGQSADVSRFGPAFTARVMWRPNHLLSVGLESGWTSLYSYETAGPDVAKVYGSQVPLYIVWSMRFWDALELFGGTGYSRVNTSLEYAGTVNNATWSLGWTASAAYHRPLSEDLGLAAELKWISPSETKDAVITLQVQLTYKFFEW